VNDINCQNIQAKVTSCTNCCNTQLCEWIYTPWSPCSAYCGQGTKVRIALCKNSVTHEISQEQSETRCGTKESISQVKKQKKTYLQQNTNVFS
jgi:hypothetical protein